VRVGIADQLNLAKPKRQERRFLDFFRGYLNRSKLARGLKARNMTAQGNALGLGSQSFIKPCKGGTEWTLCHWPKDPCEFDFVLPLHFGKGL